MSPVRTTIYSLLLLLMVACGGGGGDLASAGGEGGGIGGSGLTSLGEITGFGSIFVNGIEYDTDTADIVVNGVVASEDDLGVGMVVTVEGRVNEDGRTGVATRVVFDGVLRGPVVSAQVTDAVTGVELRVLDQLVLADLGETVFVGTRIEDIGENDYVEVSGFIGADGRLQATRVERIADFVPNESVVSRAGVVSALDGTTFSLGDLVVDFGAADLSALPEGTIAEGQRVTVRGTLSNGVITATKVAPAGDLRAGLERDQRLVTEGVVTDFDGVSTFRVGSVPVDAGEAELELAVDALANGLLVAVAGRWDGQALQATTVTSRRGEVLIAAPLQSVNNDRGTLTLGLLNTSITVNTSAVTLITDGTGQADRLRLSALAVDDYLTVQALQRGDALHAVQINRGNARASALRAAVERFTPEAEVVLQGIAIDTTQANLLDAAGEALSASEFYDRLAVGDSLLVIDALVPDGTADVVRFVGAD